MAYLSSIKAIKRVKQYLDQMVASHAINSHDDIVWVADEPHKLAYQIQNGLALAAKTGIGTYGELRDVYRIRYKGDKVIAERKDKVIPIINEFREMYDALDIISTIIKNKATLGSIEVINDLPLIITEQEILESYCKANEFKVDFGTDAKLIKIVLHAST